MIITHLNQILVPTLALALTHHPHVATPVFVRSVVNNRVG